jgi:hypothetical protein
VASQQAGPVVARLLRQQSLVKIAVGAGPQRRPSRNEVNLPRLDTFFRMTAEPRQPELEGVEFRVFRSLVREYDQDTVEHIYVQLSRDPVDRADIEAALAALADRGFVEEFEEGRWKATSQGLHLEKRLLGKAYRGY